jgi:glycosyltransferase involved in cell wall biosynthesis
MNATSRNDRPLRVLHVMGGLDRGGIETFLMHVLKHHDRARLQMDFVCHQDRVGAYDEQVLASGSQIFRCAFTSQPQKYAREFRRILKENGPFDIVHSHVHSYDGYVVKLAHQAGVPVRVAHSHNDTSHFDDKAGPARRVYLSLMRRFIQKHATLGLACSRVAATSLFGDDWEDDARWKLLNYGINLKPFHDVVDRNAQRAKLGIGADEIFVIHVGRFDPQKNHEFLIRIAKAMAEREPKVRLLMLGQGTLRPSIEKQAEELGIKERVIFGGSRPDVPHCLLAADVFLMPSWHEGLPLAGLEAQSAGLPLVVADTVTPELAVVPGQVQFLSLSQSPDEWAQAVLSAAQAGSTLSRADALATMEASEFNIENTVAALEKIYYDAAGRNSNSRTLA